MSKTRGNVLDPFAVMEQYGIDPLRFYLFREVTFGQDGVISLEGFEQRYNNELANELGNLVSRSVSMVGKYRDGRHPAGRAARRAGGLARGGRGHGRAPPASASTRSRSRRRIESRLGVRAAPQPSGRGRGALEARQGRGQAERLDAVLHGWPPACASSRWPCTPSCPARPWRSCGASASRTATADLLLEKAQWDGLTRPACRRAAPPLFPRIEASGA